MWFPNWSLHHPDARSGEVVIVDADTVVAATVEGIEPGISRREATGICPSAAFFERDRITEAQLFEPILELLEDLIPRVEVVEPGLVFIPIGGAIRYYGGVGPLVETVEGKLAPLEESWKLGVASGPFAAYWSARTAAGSHQIIEDDRRFLASLDISSLPGVESLVATFRWLGITSLGALAELPREAIASRFGEAGLSAHRLAYGEDRIVEPRRIPARSAVEMTFEEPVHSLDRLAFAAKSLSVRLISNLRSEGVAPFRVTVEVSAQGVNRSRVWRSADPFTDSTLADRIWWQLRAWIDSGGIPGGVTGLRLDPADLGAGRQLDLFESSTADLDKALARAQALVGPESVVVGLERGGRMPSERVAWYRWGEEMPAHRVIEAWPGAAPCPDPALVPARLEPIEVDWDEGMPMRIRLGSRWEQVIDWSGPWRLTGRWWRGEDPVDRYQLVTSAGAFLCVMCGGRTFLAGVYD